MKKERGSAMKYSKNSLTIGIVLNCMICFFLMSSPTYAHTQCKVPLPFGGWTEGCPHRHPPSGGDSSCFSVVTDTYYEFRVNNATGNKVYYSINEEEYSLEDGYGRNHKYRHCHGTNSCNVECKSKPEIKFDYSYESGYQGKSYSVGDYPKETFKRSGNGIDLYH